MCSFSLCLNNGSYTIWHNLQSAGVVACVYLSRHIPGLSITMLYFLRGVTGTLMRSATCLIVFKSGEHTSLCVCESQLSISGTVSISLII